MLKRMTKIIFALSLCLANFACAGADTQSTDSDIDFTANQNEISTTDSNDVVLSFQVGLTIFPENTDDFGKEFSIDLPSTYSLPMRIDDDGELIFFANDFPKIVYRLCHVDSTADLCDYYSDRDDMVDMDVVFDSCDRVIKEHAECGDADATVYEGEINAAGQLHFANIAIRTRLFFVTASGSSGYNATATMTGSINDLSRISLDLTTDQVSVAEQSFSGDTLDTNKKIRILGTGTIPEKTIGELPSLGVSEFVGEITGEFNINPFDLMGD